MPVAQKLLALETMFNKYQRVDANQPWVDISFDQVRYPKKPADSRNPADVSVHYSLPITHHFNHQSVATTAAFSSHQVDSV